MLDASLSLGAPAKVHSHPSSRGRYYVENSPLVASYYCGVPSGCFQARKLIGNHFGKNKTLGDVVIIGRYEFHGCHLLRFYFDY